MTKVGLYARVSTDEQAREGVSIDVQLLALQKWAADRSYEIIGEYIDPGHSGRDDKRPRFEMMMFDAHQGKFDIIGVSKLDRFMRNLGKLCQRLDELNQLSIGFVPLDYPQLDTSTAAGKMTLAVLGAVAEFESNRKGEQISDGKRTRISQGRWASGRTLYGYRWLPKEQQWQVVEDEAKVVRYIYDLYTNQNMGSMKIPVRLNSESYRTRSGAAWGFSSVLRVLTHGAYNGKHNLGINIPAILDEGVWELAQRKRQKARNVRGNAKNWLLQGMSICGECGHTLSCIKKKPTKPRYYGCRGRVKDSHLDGSLQCQSQRIEAEWLEKAVWDKFAITLGDSDVLKQSVNDALSKLEERKRCMEVESEPLDRQLEKTRAKIERYGVAFGDGAISEETYHDKLASLKKQEAELLARKADLDPEAQLEVSRLEDYIQSVRELLDKGWLAVQEDGIWAYRYDRVTGFADAECFGSEFNVEETIEKVTHPIKQKPPWQDDDGVTHVEIKLRPEGIWAFQHPDEARIQSMRAILQKFDTKVWAYPDRIEIRGFIPTQVIATPAKVVQSKREPITQSAYLSGWSHHYHSGVIGL